MASRTHGETKLINGKRVATPEYRSWQSMKNRCLNPKAKDYKYYGARGITVAPEWLQYETFLFDMGRRPTDKHTLERIDVNKGYGPDNCEWETRTAQARNRNYARTMAWELAERMGVKMMTAHHYIWRVKAKDKGEVIRDKLSPKKEAIVRAFMQEKGLCQI